MARIEDALRDLAADHGGLFSIGEAKRAGIPQALVVQLAHRGRLQRVSQGIYQFSSWPTMELQQYHEAVLWASAHRELAYALVSHDSALELYNLTLLNPGVIHVTIPPKTRISRTPPSWMRLHFENVDANDRRWERGVPIVSIARAIEDVATVHGIDVVHRAISEARERHLLREDEVQRLIEDFGKEILEPYHAAET